MGVGRDRRDAGDREVEGRDVVAELAAEGQEEPAEAAVDVQSDPVLQGDRAEFGDRVDRAVAVVRRRSDEGDGVGVDVRAYPVEVDLQRYRVHRRDLHVHAEEVTGLGEGRVRGLGLDDVRRAQPGGYPRDRRARRGRSMPIRPR